MLANDIFIEYYFVDDLEAEETEDEETDVEETEDEETDNEEMENDSEDPEFGSQLSVIMKYENKYYQFLMYHDTFEIAVPVMLVQTIIFLVNLIEANEPRRLVEYLTGISTDPLIPHEIPEKEFRKMAHKMLKIKFETVHRLIQEDNIDLN